MLRDTSIGPNQAGAGRLARTIQCDIDLLDKLWTHRNRSSVAKGHVTPWMRRLQEATMKASACRLDTPEFESRLEEGLMLAAGLNLALLEADDAGGRLIAQWAKIRDELNSLLLLSTTPSS